MCEKVWHKLRSPFVLSPASIGFHTCDWESFDMGLAGCLLCGSVHKCSLQQCRHLVQIEDATVCEITGCIVHHRNLVANEFDDTAMLRNSSSTSHKGQECLAGEVERNVRLLLTSQQSMDAHKMELFKTTTKFNALMLSVNPHHETIFSLVEQNMRRISSSRVLPNSFNMQQREELLQVVIQNICFLIMSTKCRMPHMLRGLDTKTLVFGLLYLMRTGISAHSVCLMPAFTSLVHLLPNESFLPKLFDFKAKNITEVENRFKFILRQCSSDDIQRMGFRDVDVHAPR